MQKIYDCFTFCAEWDVLYLRLKELESVVDEFVLVQAPFTHTGHPKPVYSLSHIRSVVPSVAASKLRLVTVRDMPNENDPWVNERFQRDAILQGLVSSQESDLAIIGDVDEIPKCTVLEQIRRHGLSGLTAFQLNFYYFRFDFRNVSGPESHRVWNFVGSVAEIVAHTPSVLREEILRGQRKTHVIKNAGWHFSYLGDEKSAAAKLLAFSHQELDTRRIAKTIDIPLLISEGNDLFGRKEFIWRKAIDRELPEEVLINLKFEHLFAGKKADRVVDLNRGIGALAEELDKAKDVLAEVSKNYDLEHKRRIRLKHDISLLKSSVSWRITKPLRCLDDLLQRIPSRILCLLPAHRRLSAWKTHKRH